jgi:hypothetical protein
VNDVGDDDVSMQRRWSSNVGSDDATMVLRWFGNVGDDESAVRQRCSAMKAAMDINEAWLPQRVIGFRLSMAGRD